MFSKFPFTLRLVFRCYATATATSLTKKCKSIDPALVDEAIKKLYKDHASVPVVIGSNMIFTGNEQKLRMPHNHGRIVAKLYFGTQNHINFAITNAISVQESWSNMDVQKRSEIFHKAADDLEGAKRKAELISAIVLSQAKTKQQAETYACKLILMIRKSADSVLNLSKVRLPNETDEIKNRYVLRPLDGFVAASGSGYMSWNNLAVPLSPLIMGNSVIWRPPVNYVLDSFLIYKAIMRAGVPLGVLQFIPSNHTLFYNTVIQSKALAAINYAGRVETLRLLWYKLSHDLENYNCFPRLVGECYSKGYHFVHKSADIDLVVQRTVQSAFNNSGQQSYSCGRLYAPASIWRKISCKLQSLVEDLQIGDPTSECTDASAIIREDIYDHIASYITYAKSAKNTEILMGGNCTKSHGYFIEPTIVICRDPSDRMMTANLMGPVLCVYVYDDNKIDDAIKMISNTQQFGSSGSIFSTDKEVTTKLINKLSMTANNLYINEKCDGHDLGHRPLSGNRLSATSGNTGSDCYLLKFASAHLIEETVQNKVLGTENSSC